MLSISYCNTQEDIYEVQFHDNTVGHILLESDDTSGFTYIRSICKGPR